MKVFKFFLVFSLILNTAFGAISGEVETYDIAALIQEVKMREGYVTGARLLREMILVTEELHKIINSAGPSSSLDKGSSKSSGKGSSPSEKGSSRANVDLDFTIIPLDELQEWATPLVTAPLKDRLIAAGVLKGKGDQYYRVGNSENKTGSKTPIEKMREFAKKELFPPEEDDAFSKLKYNEILDIIELRNEAYKSALADAYSLSLMAQFRLAEFNEKILEPFKTKLDSSEDLMDRVRKNTWAILGLASQINMSNIRSASGISVLASDLMTQDKIMERKRRLVEEEEKRRNAE